MAKNVLTLPSNPDTRFCDTVPPTQEERARSYISGNIVHSMRLTQQCHMTYHSVSQPKLGEHSLGGGGEGSRGGAARVGRLLALRPALTAEEVEGRNISIEKNN